MGDENKEVGSRKEEDSILDPDQFEAAFGEPVAAEDFGVDDTPVLQTKSTYADEDEEEPDYAYHDDDKSW